MVVFCCTSASVPAPGQAQGASMVIAQLCSANNESSVACSPLYTGGVARYRDACTATNTQTRGRAVAAHAQNSQHNQYVRHHSAPHVTMQARPCPAVSEMLAGRQTLRLPNKCCPAHTPGSCPLLCPPVRGPSCPSATDTNYRLQPRHAQALSLTHPLRPRHHTPAQPALATTTGRACCLQLQQRSLVVGQQLPRSCGLAGAALLGVHGRCKQHLHRQPASTSQQRSAPAASAERPLPRPSQLQRRYPPPWPSGPRAMRRPLLTSRATGLLGSSRAAARLGAMRSSPRHSTGTRGRPLSTAAPTRSPCSRAGGRPGTAIVGKPVPPSRPHADTLTSPPPPPPCGHHPPHSQFRQPTHRHKQRAAAAIRRRCRRSTVPSAPLHASHAHSHRCRRAILQRAVHSDSLALLLW